MDKRLFVVYKVNVGQPDVVDDARVEIDGAVDGAGREAEARVDPALLEVER